MNIDYDHTRNRHTSSGAQAALPVLLADLSPASLLDVGCGTGTWLQAAKELGISDLQGVDGIKVDESRLVIDGSVIITHDLTKKLCLGRRFDVALCFEVAEHLDEIHARDLIDTLVSHADVVFFSAACPGQAGQHHVNCQWPAYWQALFNERGYRCSDEARWKIWDDQRIECWYRQNLFAAVRAPEGAGKEPRIRPVVHPDLFKAALAMEAEQGIAKGLQLAVEGSLPLEKYLLAPVVKANRWVRKTLQPASASASAPREAIPSDEHGSRT